MTDDTEIQTVERKERMNTKTVRTVMQRELSVATGKHAIWLTVHDETPTTVALTADEAIALGEKLIQAGSDKHAAVEAIFSGL